MGQKGFFDIAQRYAGLDAKNDPLARIDEVVPWEDFRPRHYSTAGLGAFKKKPRNWRIAGEAPVKRRDRSI